VERETTAGAQGRNAIQAKFAIAAKNSWQLPGLWPGWPPKNHAIFFITMGWRLEWVRADARVVGVIGVRAASLYTRDSNSCSRARRDRSSASSSSQASASSSRACALRVCKPVFCGLIFDMTGTPPK